MTLEEFKTFKRSIALSAVKLERGEIDSKAHITDLYVTLGKETFRRNREAV